MARITVEDCLKRVGSRFELVHLTAQRVRQIREGSEYLVSSPKNEDIVVALREIAAGKVTQESIDAAGSLFIRDETDFPPAADVDTVEDTMDEIEDAAIDDDAFDDADEDEDSENLEDDDDDDDDVRDVEGGFETDENVVDEE